MLSMHARQPGASPPVAPHQQARPAGLAQARPHRPCATQVQGERESSSTGEATSAPGDRGPPLAAPRPQGRKADSTDGMASFFTRRFGLAGGLAWAGFLAFGVVSEQVKTRLETASEAKETQEVERPVERDLNGVLYTETRRGGGPTPARGDLVLLNYRLTRQGRELGDTFASGRPILFSFGSRPLPPNLCPGVEETLKAMRAGGRGRVRVPFKSPLQAGVEGSADLEYDLELVRVSIAPS